MFGGDPSCASPNDGSGQVICAATGTNDALYGVRFNPGTGFTTGYQSLGGVLVSDPSYTNFNDRSGRVFCAARGTDNTLYGIQFNPSTGFTSGYRGLGGVFVGNPSCTSHAGGAVGGSLCR